MRHRQVIVVIPLMGSRPLSRRWTSLPKLRGVSSTSPLIPPALRICIKVYLLIVNDTRRQQRETDRGVAHCDWGVLAAWIYVGGVRVYFDHLNVIFFHSKLLSDNSASFTPWRMKEVCKKIEGKTNVWGAKNNLMAWPVWPRPPLIISRQT